MREFIDAYDWLTVLRLPGHAPELNPAESVWANLKARLRNLAVRGVDQLALVIKSHLKRMQYRPGLLDAIVAQAGLNLAHRKDALSTSVPGAAAAGSFAGAGLSRPGSRARLPGKRLVRSRFTSRRRRFLAR